jgi:hypothetical protein
MSLNELRLSSSLVAMLYPNSLLDMGNDDATPVPNKPVAEQKIDEETKTSEMASATTKKISLLSFATMTSFIYPMTNSNS